MRPTSFKFKMSLLPFSFRIYCIRYEIFHVRNENSIIKIYMFFLQCTSFLINKYAPSVISVYHQIKGSRYLEWQEIVEVNFSLYNEVGF